jgi:hypothetical protein
MGVPELAPLLFLLPICGACGLVQAGSAQVPQDGGASPDTAAGMLDAGATEDAGGDGLAPPKEGGSTTDAAGAPDAADAADAVSSTDAPPEGALDAPAVDPGVACGLAYCDPTGTFPVCCHTLVPACFLAGAPCVGGFTLQCDDQADCAAQGNPSQICCATISNGVNTVDYVTCEDPANCPNPAPGKHAALLCDPLAATPCPSGQACVPNGSGSLELIGYHTCM